MSLIALIALSFGYLAKPEAASGWCRHPHHAQYFCRYVCMYFLGWGTFVGGTLVEWNIGRTEHWSNGTLVEWNIGRMEHWSNGTLVEWNIGRTEHWSNGTLVERTFV